MTAVSETDSSLTTKCLDFCQALAGQGKIFKFSITIGSTFTFSLDTRDGKEIPPTRSRKSPSTLRRNAKRRKEFLLKKSNSETASESGLESNQTTEHPKDFQCDQCDLSFKTEKGLKIHKGKSHKEASSPEKVRTSLSQSSLTVSPVRDLQTRMEPCHNCGLDMSPTHSCQNDQDSEPDEVPEVQIICGCGCGASERCPRHYQLIEVQKQMVKLMIEQRR